jgi:excisionase family DNA binding protein
MNDQNPTPNPLLTVEEAAAGLRVSRSTIWRWCQEGVFTSAFKIGRNWRIHRAELEKIIGQALPGQNLSDAEDTE